MSGSAYIKEAIAYLKGIALSYAQIYFSRNVVFGLVLMMVSFFDLGIGISGVIAIVICQLCSWLFGFGKEVVQNGSYCYNALMVGLALGGLYTFSGAYVAVLVLASALTFLLTVWIGSRLGSKGLPFLSLPFLITIWILLSGLGNFSNVQLGAKSTFSLHQWFPDLFTWTAAVIGNSRLADVVHLYLRSVSAILFQYNDLAGIIIAAALLLRSRMAFALSIYGFLTGYAFYYFFAGDFTPLVYSYVGFNFILTAIALGGFFLVPSAKSHLLLLLIIPVTALLISAMHTLFSRLDLPLYSLPFNLIVLLVIGALHMRGAGKSGLQLVALQQYSPEENHYKSIYYNKRFSGQFYYHLHLPVMGEWTVSQGYNGSITHKGEWQHALDFDVREQGQTYSGTGFSPKDYYCYELPVLAPATGYVTTIRDGIPDNAIGDVNLGENWGNTIIIKHAEGLYTKLSHLKAGSFKVKEGSYVQSGELIASCGSSGRSPEPHLHYQAQALPHIGAHTLHYPLAYYLLKKDGQYSFHSFEIPAEGDVVRNVIAHPLLANALGLVPGQELHWHVVENGKAYEAQWSIFADVYNRTYIYCHLTRAAAYFYNDGTLFYFTDFYGSKRSFLYHFQLSFQKILLGYYAGIELNDALQPQAFFNKGVMALQDFAAPFVHFTSGEYRLRFEAKETTTFKEGIAVATKINGRLFGREMNVVKGALIISSSGLEQVAITGANFKIEATCAPLS